MDKNKYYKILSIVKRKNVPTPEERALARKLSLELTENCSECSRYQIAEFKICPFCAKQFNPNEIERIYVW